MAAAQSRTPAVLKKYGNEILAIWMSELAGALQTDRRISESELSNQTCEFLNLIQTASSSNGIAQVESDTWTPVREFLDSISRSRVPGFQLRRARQYSFSP